MIPEPSTKSLSREDFPGQADWIEPLLRAVNAMTDGMASIVKAINAQGGTAYMDLDIPGTYENAFPKLIANPLGAKATHVYATAVVKRTAPSDRVMAETRALFVEWENSATSDGARQLKIKMVSGLSASTNYRITLKVEA